MEQKGGRKDELLVLLAYIRSTQRPLNWHVYGVGIAVLATVGVFPDQFTAIPHSTDPNDGDIIWMIPRIDGDFHLVTHHWEVLSLEASCEKLLSAETVGRHEFEEALRSRLTQIP